MTKEKTKIKKEHTKSCKGGCEVGKFLKGLAGFIERVVMMVWHVIWRILEFVLSLIKAMALFVIGNVGAIAILLIGVSLSVFLLSKSIGLTESPTFQQFREKVIANFVINLDLENKIEEKVVE